MRRVGSIPIAISCTNHMARPKEEQPTSRELEVLKLVVEGMSNKEIASLLGISHQTVKNHVTSILRKFGVEDRTQAVVYALKRGWVKLQDDQVKNQE